MKTNQWLPLQHQDPQPLVVHLTVAIAVKLEAYSVTQRQVLKMTEPRSLALFPNKKAFSVA